MQAASINTTCSNRACVLFTVNPIVKRASIMLRISLLLCIVPTSFGIIVQDPPPSPNDYKYSYDIQDPTTGDRKSQHEVRQGDVVTGAYTVVGPDGTKRTVEYTADAKNGFQAVVSEEPASQPVAVTSPPAIQQTLSSFDYNALKYYNSSPRPVYTHTVQVQPKVNYVEEKPSIYFTPQNEIESRLPFTSGHYFIPANDKY